MKYTSITDDDVGISMQLRKNFLFYDGSPSTKKDGNEDFDIPMGCLVEQNAVNYLVLIY